MPELRFTVRGVHAAVESALPGIELSLAVENLSASELIHGALLRCQVFIDAPRRHYTPAEAERLSDLFGARREWHRTLQRFCWATEPLLCPSFTGAATLALAIPCPLDPEGRVGKYLWALEAAAIPIVIALAGTVFHAAPERAVSATPLPWNTELVYPLPLAPLAELRRARGGRCRLELSEHVFERLYEFQRAQLLTSWDDTISRLIERGASV
jgi:hypothetical protein